MASNAPGIAIWICSSRSKRDPGMSAVSLSFRSRDAEGVWVLWRGFGDSDARAETDSATDHPDLGTTSTPPPPPPRVVRQTEVIGAQREQ